MDAQNYLWFGGAHHIIFEVCVWGWVGIMLMSGWTLQQMVYERIILWKKWTHRTKQNLLTATQAWYFWYEGFQRHPLLWPTKNVTIPNHAGASMWDTSNTSNDIYIWRFVKMSVPSFVDKSQFHACRLMFAFKKHDPPWWRENVEILRYLWKSFQNHRNRLTHVGFSFAVAGTISWTVCLCAFASLNAICFLTCLLINAVSLL